MKRKFILITMIAITIGITACSADTKTEEISVNMDSRQETDQEQTADLQTANLQSVDLESVDTKMEETEMRDAEPSNPEPAEAERTDITEVEIEDIPQGDPIAGIVDAYDGSTITVRTPEDDMRYCFSAENVPVLEGFSTESAQAADGDFTISVGDKVEVSYQGLLDDKEHPIHAVKIVVVPADKVQ